MLTNEILAGLIVEDREPRRQEFEHYHRLRWDLGPRQPSLIGRGVRAMVARIAAGRATETAVPHHKLANLDRPPVGSPVVRQPATVRQRRTASWRSS